MALLEGVEGALYMGDGVGARHCHIIEPHQLPRPLLDKLTYNRLKINGVDLRNKYKAAEGEWALE
jgi:hypothetical protein